MKTNKVKEFGVILCVMICVFIVSYYLKSESRVEEYPYNDMKVENIRPDVVRESRVFENISVDTPD